VSLLSTSDLSWMRDTQELAMPGTVVIERRTLTANGMGGHTEVWAAVGTVIGRIYPRSTRGQGEVIGGAQVQSTMDWYGTFPTGTDVIAADRLLYQSRTWEVARVNNDEMYQTSLRCDLETLNEERRV
jgi:head-tail adaptor